MKKRKRTPGKRAKKLQKRADEAVRRQRELLQKTFDSITDAIFILDAPSPPGAPRILECNEAASSVFGYEKAEMLGRSTDFLHVGKETLKEFQSQLYPAVAESRLPFYLSEFRMKRKDGSVFHSEHVVTQLLNEKGDRTGWISIVRDITKRKQAEEEIRRLASFPQLTPASIVELDSAGGVVYCNPAATSRLRELGVGDDPRLYLPSDVDEILKALEQRRDMQFSREVRIKDAIFSEVIYIAREFGTVRIYASDITERKRSEEMLRESEERYRKLFEGAMDGIALADANTGILLDCNQALAALVGRNKTELIGQHQTILHPPASDRNAFSPTFKLHLTTHEGQVLETQVITGTGQTRDVEIKASLLHLQGRRILLGIFRDITERKRVEEEVRRRAEELAALQATVLDITGHQDLPVLLQTIVERAARLLGAPAGGMYLCDPEKQEARCVVSYNTPHDYAGTVLKYGEGAAGIVAQTGEPLVIDDYRTWQGRATVFEEKRPFKAVLTVPMIWQGRVTGVIHVLDDASSRRFTHADQELLTLFANHAAIAVENARLLEQEKRHGEELARYSTSLERLVLERTRKLTESERRFRELSDLLPQIVFEIDEKGMVQYMNRAGLTVTGLSDQEFRRGLNAFHFLVPQERDRARRGIQRVISGEMIGEREFAVLRKDGTSFPALVSTAPITRGGKIVGLRGIAIDITQRKRAEEELRSARERLQHVITSNPAVIITGKPRADLSHYNVTYMSDRVVEMLGFEPQQFIGHPEFWDGRVHPEDLRRYPTEVPKLWRKGHCTFEYRFLHKDGTYRWIREEAKVIRDPAGNPVEVIGYWTDATEQKQMQEALLKSQRLATIGEVAAMVGHDLRNPLAAIAGATYLLRKQAADKINDNGRESLQIIEKSIEHSDKIIGDLLEYSAEVKLQTSMTDPKSVTGAALSLARIPDNVRMVNETQAEPRIVIDSDKIQRAFLNIIRNAVEAMPEGGTLTISSSRTDGMVEFRFEDTGAGMSRENLEKLWTPLFTTKAKGMGFGLAITRRIVEAHGGTVAADSAPGRGSTFAVKLPIELQTQEVSGS